MGLLTLSAFTGCVGIQYTATQTQAGVTNSVSIKANRFFWSTESYVCTLSTNGTGTLQASKSTVDSVALGAVAQGVAQGLASGVK